MKPLIFNIFGAGIAIICLLLVMLNWKSTAKNLRAKTTKLYPWLGSHLELDAIDSNDKDFFETEVL